MAIVEGTHAEILQLLRDMRGEVDVVTSMQSEAVVSPSAVVEAAARVCGVRWADVCDSPTRQASYARHLAMYVLRPTMTVADMGRFFKRDHSSVLAGVARIKAEMGVRPETVADVEAVRTALQNATTRPATNPPQDR